VKPCLSDGCRSVPGCVSIGPLPEIWQLQKERKWELVSAFQESVQHFHSTKCFGARGFRGAMDYYFFTGRAIFQQKRVAYDLRETRQRESRIVSGRLLQRGVAPGKVKGNRGPSSRDTTGSWIFNVLPPVLLLHCLNHYRP
jgi:hypothetical protein